MTIFEKIKNFFIKPKTREEQILEDCGCVCYCPACKEPLNDQADLKYDEEYEYYTCSCGEISVWDFRHPVPILRSHAPKEKYRICDFCGIRSSVGKTKDAANICNICCVTYDKAYVPFEMLDAMKAES